MTDRSKAFLKLGIFLAFICFAFLIFMFAVIHEERAKLPKIGTTADDVLDIRGECLLTNVVGKDSLGLIVEWYYEDVVYVFRRATADGITCYRIAEIKGLNAPQIP